MKSLFLILTLGMTLYAQNLSKLVALASKNATVQAQKQSLASTKAHYEQTKRDYLPTLGLNANYQYTNQESIMSAQSALSAYAEIGYNLYDGGRKEHTYEAFDATIASQEKSIKALENEIALSVIRYYYGYLSLLSAKEAKHKEIEQLSAQKHRLETFLAARLTTKDEVAKIEARTQNAQVLLSEIAFKLQEISEHLSYITGVEVSIDRGSHIALMDEKSCEREDIQALALSLKALENEAKITKSATMPRLDISNRYTHYDWRYENALYDIGMKDQNVIGINLSWKLFDFGATQKAYEAKHQEYLAMKSRYEYAKAQASTTQRIAQKALRVAQEKIKSAKSALDASSLAYEYIKIKYENALVDNVAYLEALSEKYQAKELFERLVYDEQIKRAELLYHSGKELQGYIQ